MTFVQGHSDSTFSNLFCSETARPIEDKFHMEPPWDVRNDFFFSYVSGHMTMPIYEKKLQKSSSSILRGR